MATARCLSLTLLQYWREEGRSVLLRSNWRWPELKLDEIFEGLYVCPGEVQDDPASSCLEVSQCGPQLPSEYYWVTSANGSAVQVYCDMTRECKCSSASVGGWSRVAYLNTTDPTHQCPPAWRERTDTAVRTCGRTDGSFCSSVTFSSHGISYSHICGRIIGHLWGSLNGFLLHSREPLC